MTLYLSEIEVDFPTARRLALWDDYRWHQAVWQAFPNRPDKSREFLTRVDRAPSSFRAWLLSPEPPQPPSWGHWQFKPVADSFLSHNRYVFSLRASPTRKKPSKEIDERRQREGKRLPYKNSKRVPILEVDGPSGLRTWFEGKGRDHGFTLDETKETGAPLSITKEPRHRLWIEEVRNGNGALQRNPNPSIWIHSVLFEGVLVVTNREAFRQVFYGRTDPRSPDLIIRGIGSAKGFGFGLLVITPLQ
jgi:CRISPR system Cascade subunit CasE